jgi:hypothetical protein
MFGLGNKVEKKEETTAEIGEASNELSAEIVAANPPGNEVENNVTHTDEHVCDENCQHNPPPLTRKEAKYLKRAKYNPNDNKFNTSYVIKNNKTGQIVEICAASSFHACNIIGWKPNKVVVLAKRDLSTDAHGEKEVKREDTASETVSSSNT